MEIDSLFYYAIVVVVSLLIAVWSTGVLTAIIDLSWGRIRKLDPEKRKNLVSRSKQWLEQRRHLRVIFRSLILISLAVLSITCFKISLRYIPSSFTIPGVLICSVISSAVFVVATEILGNGILTSYQWRLLNLSAPAIRLLYFIFNPLTTPIVTFQQRFYSLRDEDNKEERSTIADEIISLVEQDAHGQSANGKLEASERQMIRGIFDLDETLVKEIMTPRVDLDVIDVTATIAEAKKNIIESGHSRIPVVKGRVDEIVGLIYAKDLLNDARLKKIKTIEKILHPPVFIPETKNISDLLDEFRQNKNHIAVIIDEYGGTAGIVTIEDILEEIVGEIQDEYDSDEDEPHYSIKEDGSVVVDARMPIDEINEILGMSISEEEEYDTIGGYVSSELGRIPKARELVEIGNLQAQILLADARKISKLKLKKIDEPNGSQPPEEQ